MWVGVCCSKITTMLIVFSGIVVKNNDKAVGTSELSSVSTFQFSECSV